MTQPGGAEGLGLIEPIYGLRMLLGREEGELCCPPLQPICFCCCLEEAGGALKVLSKCGKHYPDSF